VNSLFHPGRQNAVCTVFPDRLAASDASAGRDVVLLQNAARFLASFQAPDRDSPWVTGALALSVGPPARQVPQPLDG
jgi:hypothetical protein